VTNLVVKLTLTPALIALISLVGRRWGPALSGWLVGLPFTSGPIALLLALDHGAHFAAVAAQGILAGGFSEVAYCLTYVWLARRRPWAAALPASVAAFLLVTVALQPLTPPVVPLFACVLAAFALGLRAFPPDREAHDERAMPARALVPRWEIPARMLLATALVLLLTGLASVLGPRLSGLLAPFPLYATILAVFTQHFAGPRAAARLLRGVVYGLFAFATFFFVLALLLERGSIVPAFLLASLSALLVQGATLRILQRGPGAKHLARGAS
jgi:hypothetical protein